MPEQPKVQILVTADGSTSLYMPHLDETYHSRHGAVQEAKHVFIATGLLNCSDISPLKLLEVGFGTGLNAVLTCLMKPTGQEVEYHSLETFPLSSEITQQLHFALHEFKEGSVVFQALHSAPWNELTPITPEFSLAKHEKAIQEVEGFDGYFDLIYYDAFGPRAQPDMWTVEVFERLYQCTKSGGKLVTYCAKGQVRRDLQSVGYKAKRLPGPPGKREMLMAIKE